MVRYIKHTKGKILFICICLISLFSSNLVASEPNVESYKRGVKLYDSWKYNDALNAFIEADKLYPHNGYIYYYVGEIMYFADKYQDSFEFTKQSLNYFKQDDSIGKANAYLHLAFLSQNVFLHKIDGLKEDDAAFYFDAAVRVAPHYAKAYKERGNFYNIYKSDFIRSDADYLKAIELEPDEVEPYSRLIWSYRDRGLTDKAKEYCLKCIANVRDYPYHYDTLVKILLQENKIAEARKLLWEAFLKCDRYYYQGMETVALFPEGDQNWFRAQIQKQHKLHPTQEQWMKYLE